MSKKRYKEEQIIGFLKEADSGVAMSELCLRHGFSSGSFYAWKKKFGGMDVSVARKKTSGSYQLKLDLKTIHPQVYTVAEPWLEVSLQAFI